VLTEASKLESGQEKKEDDMKTVGVIGVLMATAVFLAPSGGRAWAEPDETGQASAHDEGAALQTPEALFARAASYREKAASYRAEAEMHRKMLAEYETKRVSPSHKTTGTGRRKSPWIAKMRTHCNGYIEAAEEFAVEADRFAEFYRMRGEEMKDE
jgi:hypothetical protein